uniref:Queuosine 5'-phosphate N-glycosylase/hydrolase n=1 Tax=Bicosoecida sp. CB-2014 TaxID=1486930 RepID=A0A7S1C8G2_9STRA
MSDAGAEGGAGGPAVDGAGAAAGAAAAETAAATTSAAAAASAADEEKGGVVAAGGGSTVFDLVRASCASLVAAGKGVRVDEGAAAALAAAAVAEGASGGLIAAMAEVVRPPIVFDSIEAEVNYWCVLHMLSFGEGWREDVKKEIGKGVSETMMFGVLGLYLGGCTFDAAWMRGVSVAALADALQLPISMEVPIMPAVYETRAGPLKPLVEAAVRVLNDAGEALRREGCADMAAFVLSNSGGGGGGGASAAALVKRLAAAFPSFNDVAVAGAEAAPVRFYANATLLASALHRLCGERDARCRFGDAAAMPAAATPALVAALVRAGVVAVDEGVG